VEGETRTLHSTDPFDSQMPSQERRRAERDAAKRAPAQAGAAGATVAAAALANVNLNPLGHWTTQAEDHFAFRAIGAENVKRMAGEGDGGAQYSQGYRLPSEAEGATGTPLGTAGRSPWADVGFAPHSFPVAHQTATCRVVT